MIFYSCVTVPNEFFFLIFTVNSKKTNPKKNYAMLEKNLLSWINNHHMLQLSFLLSFLGTCIWGWCSCSRLM